MDSFPYQSVDVSPSLADASRKIWRPILPVTVIGKDRATALLALVDTGAVETLVPYEFLADVNPEVIGGGILEAANGSQISVFYAKVDLALRLGRRVHRWGTIVGFTQDREEMVLGDAGFFRYFQCTFDRHHKRLAIRKNADLPEPFHPTPTPRLARPFRGD